MPRNILLLVLAIFPLIAGTTCLGQEPSKKERPMQTFEDSVRLALVDSRNNYLATARFLESQRTRGYIQAVLCVVAGAGGMMLGLGPAAFAVAAPGAISGVLQAAEAGALRKVMQGQNPTKARRKMLDRDDY